jgi:hypothetical protein
LSGGTKEEPTYKNYYSLEKNIKSKIKELGNIHLYIWLGTCDLTTKNKDGTISLARQHSETSKNIFD